MRVFALMGRVFAERPDSEAIQTAEVKPLGAAWAAPQGRNSWWERWGAVGVIVLAAILDFGRLGARALWASEFRWAEIAREMLVTHDYFWPTINGRVYFDKPLGSYWLVLASASITGAMDEAAARIPGALAGVLAVVLLILLVRRLYDLRTGVAAGLVLATSLGFAFWARTACADIETIAGELAALLVFKKNENRAGWWVLWLWLIMALTSMMKGLPGFVLPILVIGAYSFIADGWPGIKHGFAEGSLKSWIAWLIARNRWFFNWRTTIAVTLAGLIYFAPFAISYAATGSGRGIYMVYRENVERYFAPFDHRGPIYLYVYVLFALMAPWSAFLPAALIHVHGHVDDARTVQSDRFVLAFFWTTFIFFTLSGSRRSYYILPILPAAAILVARIFAVPQKDLSEGVGLLMKTGFGVVASLALLSVAFLLPPKLFLPFPYSLLPMLPWRGIYAICWVVSLAIIGYACVSPGTERIFLSVNVSSYLLLLYLFIFAMPAGDQWRGEKGFARTARGLIDNRPEELASFRTEPPVFYLGLPKPVREYDTPGQLQSAVRDGRIKWIISRRRDVSAINLKAQEAAFEPIYPWDSADHRANALVLMRIK